MTHILTAVLLAARMLAESVTIHGYIEPTNTAEVIALFFVQSPSTNYMFCGPRRDPWDGSWFGDDCWKYSWSRGSSQ